MSSSPLGAPFVEHLGAQALKSPAVTHPYLQAIHRGDFPDVDGALRDFAHQYGVYSLRFTDYLSAVIANLRDPKHRAILEENLEEERGHLHDVELPADVVATIDGHPHAELFKLFQTAMGLDLAEEAEHDAGEPGVIWSRRFLELCQTNEYVGVGAIGIGTELIVASIYRQILAGLKAHTQLSITERVFFELHSECDDEHAAQLNLIAADLADNAEAAEQIAYGAQMALTLREQFWNMLLDQRVSKQPRCCPVSEGASNGAATRINFYAFDARAPVK